jgi:glycerol-3-phosphate dehydrogenase
MPRGNPNAQVYFLLPWKGKILAGTGHAPWHGSQDEPNPSMERLTGFLTDLNRAVPALQVSQEDIFHVFAGLLPVTKTGSVNLATREVVINHADQGGPRGLFSISGVKFTTSRLVAEKTLNRIFPGRRIHDYLTSKEFAAPIATQGRRGIFDSDGNPMSDTAELRDRLQLLVKEEAVQHLDDLIVRRTSLWNIPQKALKIAPQICDFFDWDYHRRLGELERLKDALPLVQSSEKTGTKTREVPLFNKAVNARNLETA